MSISPNISSVVVDGKNLALRHGTGVATYARSLCTNLQASDTRVELLYGEAIRHDIDAKQAAVAFFEGRPGKCRLPLGLCTVARYARRYSQPFRTIVPEELRLDDASLSEHYRGRLPAADRSWNATDVFDMPQIAIRSGYFQNVRNVMGADAAHWTYPVPVKLQGAANIYTLHDLVPLKLPDTTLDDKRTYHAMIKKITETADLIVTVSEQSKQDIHSYFDLPDERVINTYQDVDIPDRLLSDNEQIVSDFVGGVYGLQLGQYVLFYGAVEPKKNVGRLIEAHLASDLDIPLVIAGKDGWLVEDELRLYTQHLERRIGPQRIIRLPYVTRHQLINLVRGAGVVAFPSLYEGFGLPLVEAMTCGTPLLTSNFGAMKEIAGEAAVLVDPYDVSSIRDGLKRIASDTVLRNELRVAGRERSTFFSSEQYRKRLSAAYSSAT